MSRTERQEIDVQVPHGDGHLCAVALSTGDLTATVGELRSLRRWRSITHIGSTRSPEPDASEEHLVRNDYRRAEWSWLCCAVAHAHCGELLAAGALDDFLTAEALRTV